MDQNQLNWLYSRFQTRGLEANVHVSLARNDNDWMYVPVYVALQDSYHKAEILQEI